MNTTQWKTIRRIARETRRDLEKYSDFLYQILDMDFEENFCGLCAFASKLLHSRLRKRGVASTVIQGSDNPKNTWAHHVWVEVEGKVVDLTASQFDPKHPKVYIAKNPPRDADGGLLYPTKRRTFSDWSCREKPTKDRLLRFEAFCAMQKKLHTAK